MPGIGKSAIIGPTLVLFRVTLRGVINPTVIIRAVDKASAESQATGFLREELMHTFDDEEDRMVVSDIEVVSAVRVEPLSSEELEAEAITKTGFSHKAAVETLKRIAQHCGTGVRGTYDKVDPTAFEQRKFSVVMEVGFGNPIPETPQCPACGAEMKLQSMEIGSLGVISSPDDRKAWICTDDTSHQFPFHEQDGPPPTLPPDPEVVAVSINDVTWGTNIQITSQSLSITGYWDHETGNQAKPHWGLVSWVHPGKHVVVGMAAIAQMHEVIVKLITEGDWGNDKLPSYEEDPMGGIES